MNGCVSPAALKFLDIVDAARLREGRARLGEINRAINLAIRPISDLAQHGQIDVWTSPLATLARGGGDCEDYAIAKFVALRRAGIAPDDLGSWSCTIPSTARTMRSLPRGWTGAG